MERLAAVLLAGVMAQRGLRDAIAPGFLRPEGEAVQTYRVDMGKVCGPVCNAQLPNSRLVVDRVHVAKHFGEVIDDLKPREWNALERLFAEVPNSCSIAPGNGRALNRYLYIGVH